MTVSPPAPSAHGEPAAAAVPLDAPIFAAGHRGLVGSALVPWFCGDTDGLRGCGERA